jgi:acyl dehydratase
MPLASDREQLRYFEDFEVGMTSEFGPRAITEAEIIDFAAQWDPQPFHLDGEAARASMYGGLIASGWHTAVVTMSMLATKRPLTAGAGSPGLDELRWLAPVRRCGGRAPFSRRGRRGPAPRSASSGHGSRRSTTAVRPCSAT